MYFTINDLLNLSTSKDVAILGDVSKFDFMQDYVANYKVYDNVIGINYGEKIIYNPRWYKSIDDIFEKWKIDVQSILTLNQEKYKRYLQINNVEFSPIENYDRFEDTTITRNGIVENRTGSVTDATVLSGTETNMETVEHGNNVLISNNMDAPYDGGLKETQKITSTNQPFTDTDTNVKTFDERTDTKTTTFNGQKNEIDNSETVKSHTHGNIGVTTATAMMRESVEFWDNFNFMTEIFSDIIMKLTMPFWESEESRYANNFFSKF